MDKNNGEIKIIAHPSPAGNACRFVLERSLYDGIRASFAAPESAKGSPLAEQLFAVEGIARVGVANDSVRVSLKPGTDLRVVAAAVGKVIRAHHASGDIAVADDMKDSFTPDDEIRDKVEEVLWRDVNPSVGQHGGFISLVDVRDSKIYIRMGGGCHGCGMADVTLKQGVSEAIRKQVPEVIEIIDVTDHASGGKPYIQPGENG